MLRRKFLSLACFSPIAVILGNTQIKNSNRYIDVKKEPFELISQQTFENQTLVWHKKVYCTNNVFTNCIIRCHQDSIFENTTFVNCTITSVNMQPHPKHYFTSS